MSNWVTVFVLLILLTTVNRAAPLPKDVLPQKEDLSSLTKQIKTTFPLPCWATYTQTIFIVLMCMLHSGGQSALWGSVRNLSQNYFGNGVAECIRFDAIKAQAHDKQDCVYFANLWQQQLQPTEWETRKPVLPAEVRDKSQNEANSNSSYHLSKTEEMVKYRNSHRRSIHQSLLPCSSFFSSNTRIGLPVRN